jgi:cardiolipin synthase
MFVLFIAFMHLLGALTSVSAIMDTRTSQGAIAWAVSLNAFPYLSVPAYWILGQSHFDNYDVLRRQGFVAESETAQRGLRELDENGLLSEPETFGDRQRATLLQNLAKLPFTKFNQAELLIDGEETFDAIFEGIATAEDYILVQFYIWRDDVLGQKLKNALLAKAAEGVRVFALYDGLGSYNLSQEYLDELRAGGVDIRAFMTTKGRGNRFRINFRNHRKIVVVDGHVGYVGGSNVGDEYLGHHPVLTPWRDTHVALRGPAVLGVQVSFLEDWLWVSDTIPELNWTPIKAPEGNASALCLATGPADELETASLFFIDAINAAQERLWIVSPYFVPDEQLMSALQLAALRGVDVRILIPENPDQKLVYLSSFSYLEEAEKSGVQIYRYMQGFLHQKVMLIDDRASAIGTCNFDNRSMRLNFEITMIIIDEDFANEVEAMLENDFSVSRRVASTEYTDRDWWFRFQVRVARLMAPIQ